MLVKTILDDGRILVTSDEGQVDIGADPVNGIIVDTEEEVEYIEEVHKHN